MDEKIPDGVYTTSSTSNSPEKSTTSNIFETQGTSNRVQQLASALYHELDIISSIHGSQTIEGTIPLIIRTLEYIDDTTRDLDLSLKENEQLKEDQVQFLNELEREKTLRKQSETKLIALEDSFEDERKKFKDDLEKLSTSHKQLDLQLKNANDHSSRLEERLSESKKESSKLQSRINELIQSNAEYTDRIKALQISNEPTQSSSKLFIPKRSQPFNSSDLGGFDEMPADMSDFLTADDDILPDQSFSTCDRDFECSELGEGPKNSTGEFAGAHSEIQKLIKEYMDLSETKEALSIVKDDLITQVDSLNSENLHLQSIIQELNELKSITEDKLGSSEQQLAKLRTDHQLIKQELDARKAEDDLPSNQRKRFTSAELRQVINERNRYKKELFELEDAVRLMEIARASQKVNLEFATLSGHELTNAVRMAAEQYSKPVNASGTGQNNQDNQSPGLSALAKFFSISFGRSNRGSSIADNDSASICSADSPRKQYHRPSTKSSMPQSSWISLNVAKQYAPVYGWSNKHDPSKSQNNTESCRFPIPVHCRQIETLGQGSPVMQSSYNNPRLCQKSFKLEITVGVALTEGFKSPIIWLAGRGNSLSPDSTIGSTTAQVYIFDILQMAKPLCQFELPSSFIPMTGTSFLFNNPESNFPLTKNEEKDGVVNFEEAQFHKQDPNSSESTLGVIMGSNDGLFLIYRLPTQLSSPQENSSITSLLPSQIGQFKLRERGQTANEITSYKSNILMAISSPSGQTRLCIIRWSLEHLVSSSETSDLPVILCSGPTSIYSLPRHGDGAGPIILARKFVTETKKDNLEISPTNSVSLWMGTVGGGYLHCFEANFAKFAPMGISLPESTVCMHSLDFARQFDGDFLLAAVSGPAFSRFRPTNITESCTEAQEHLGVSDNSVRNDFWATSVARIVRISVDQRTLVQIFDITEAITKAVDISNVTDPVDLTICRLLMESSHWVWFITRSGLIGRLNYDDHVINDDSVLVQCPQESLYLCSHGFRRALIAAFMHFDNVSTFGAHVLAIGHDYVDLRLKTPIASENVVRLQPNEYSFNSKRGASTNAHVIIWRLQ